MVLAGSSFYLLLGLLSSQDPAQTPEQAELLAGKLLREGAEHESHGRWDKAAECYLSFPKSSDLSLRPSKGSALYRLAGCYYQLGKYEPSLDTYRQAQEYSSFISDTGTETRAFRASALVGQGLCLERLGRYGDALTAYLGAQEFYQGNYGPTLRPILRRIVDLADAAGRRQWLKQELERRGKKYDEEERTYDPTWHEYFHPTAKVLRYIEILEAEQAAKWGELIALLREAPGHKAPNSFNLLVPWEPLEVSAILARHAKETAPLLAENVKGRSGIVRPWVCYALGLCGTSEAVAILKERVQKDPGGLDGNWWDALIVDLQQAGEEGRVAITELDSKGGPELKSVVARCRERAQSPSAVLEFPAIPKSIKIP